jgi:Zn-finger nucleic acid-binding protein
MICPRDKVPLVKREIDGYHYHFCDRCHGVWFSKSGLQKYISDQDRPQIIKTGQEPWETHDARTRPGLCPVDGKTPMILGIKYGVYVDICHEHKGIWLDNGELDMIIEGIYRSLNGNIPGISDSGQVTGEPSSQGSGDNLFNTAGENTAVADAVFGAIAEIVESLFR